MQVILKKEVQNIGEAGDLVTVKDGYARNFLIPKNYAEIATEGALKNREQNIARIRAKQEKLNQEALAKVAELEKIGSIELSAKAGESGKLFGTITTKKLCEEIKAKSNIEIDRKSINYSRFVSHMHYLIKRVKENTLVENENHKLYESLAAIYPETEDCTKKICQYLKNKINCELTEEESVYLMLHVNRLCAR